MVPKIKVVQRDQIEKQDQCLQYSQSDPNCDVQ